MESSCSTKFAVIMRKNIHKSKKSAVLSLKIKLRYVQEPDIKLEKFAWTPAFFGINFVCTNSSMIE